MMPADKGRWMSIDWGDRRIGLAISDPSGMIATPAGTIERRAGKRPPVAEVVRRAVALEARAIVMGLPLDGEGDDTPRAVECRVVAAELARRTKLPVALLDERYTTAAALRGVREAGGNARDRKQTDIDALAAGVLLQQALRMPALDTVVPAADPSVPPPRPDATPS
ncbi:MAG: Holliday junction resolvase [Gemmatimonadetes bacterium]|jgi:putative Holliday junction resolvase|nr:Holliday junction resolvase [Gemmatimonadota bacterium]